MPVRLFWCSGCGHDHTRHRPVYVEDDYRGTTEPITIKGRRAVRMCSVARCACKGVYRMETTRPRKKAAPRASGAAAKTRRGTH